MPDIVEIETVGEGQLFRHVDALAAILQACVADGASVGFLLPFDLAAARAYWHKIEPSVVGQHIKLLVARIGEEAVGTVQLHLETPANGRHRAEVAKLLVHPKARRQGVARRLMEAVEALAVQHGRGLLVLDTRAGDNAERLYRNLGWQTAGIIPNYALSTIGVLCDTVMMFKNFR